MELCAYRITDLVLLGTELRNPTDGSDSVGLVRLQFPDRETQLALLPKLDDLILVEVNA